MKLIQLKADNFRLFQTLSLQPHGRLNFFFGANAAGKTTLLESIYCLGRAKSFRGSSPQELAGISGKQWTVFGRSEQAGQAATQQGLRWTPEGSEIRINSDTASTLDLIRRFPVQILEPGMHKVLQDGPTYRRSFLDWGVFHVEPSFMVAWSRYRRALRQRNQLLREQGSDRELAVWEPELAETGTLIHGFRQQHLAKIQPDIQQRIQTLLNEGEWAFDLHSGWNTEYSLAEALAKHRDRDRRMGTTLDGPHRAELRIRAGDHAIKNRISRGQQKLLIAALLLAQCLEIYRELQVPPVLLVDDFGAELADQFQAALLDALQQYPGQVFVTAFERSGALQREMDASMFHVEHGTVAALAS
jgi:DNA replication and repair protein RecF